MAKKKHKYRTNKTSEISRNQDKTFPNKSNNPIEFTSQELNMKSNFIFYILIFSAFLSLTLFIFYFLQSLDSFSYMVSFYPIGEPLTYFFIGSFAIVIICLLLALYYNELFEKRIGNYAAVCGIFYTVLVSFLVVYPNSSGYVPIINNPLIGVIFFVLDLAVELTPFFIGFKIFKSRSV